ncbi:MAG: hypothetical protein V1774_10875, partial [Candidatus Eisenbacteria bacterium]
DVRVGRLDWGKAEDNYELRAGEHTLWASDYYNLDLAVPPFPLYFVRRGERYTRIAGIYQEYLHPEEGWDYYQLLPRGTGDYARSTVYTLRDVQESSVEHGWASPLAGGRVDVQAVVSASRAGQGRLALCDRLLGNTWAGILVDDPGGELAGLAIGDEIRLSNVLVAEEGGLTLLAFDEESSWMRANEAVPVAGVAAALGDLRRDAPAESAEPYEGMLVTFLNLRVARRGVPEGEELYYLAAGGDTLLATDAATGLCPPGGTFFVRDGDRLGSVSGIVVQRDSPAGPIYVLQPRLAADYYFVADDATYMSWGRLKRSFQ